jgi:hypothetical protein
VLLVCIYNQFGNIITHDYLYLLFCPYGSIVKILIFEKAKVWKTFIEYSQVEESEKALMHLDNKVIFEDGSKMNIFRSKLKHVQFHNDNLGGVNYESLKQQQLDNSEQFIDHNRKRRSTFQDYIVPFYAQEPLAETYYNFLDKDHDQSSTSAKYKSESLSAKKSKESSSFNNLMDIDEQFREIALESEEFRTWEETTEINRRKSKTIVNPNSEQFLMENCPSKVLFARSLPENFDHDCIYNIFSNFGKVSKVIFIKEKSSALVEFETQLNAIQAKDEINYAKPNFKVFYSHYETLVLKKLDHNEEEYEYKSEGVARPPNYNPPSEILYMTMTTPACEQEVRELCQALDCPVYEMEWKQNGKDKWMCLVEFGSLSESLLVMGKLQGQQLANGKKMRLSFTRSRIKRNNNSPSS